MDENRLARGLGWFSVGLGMAELVAPRAISRLVGTGNHKTLTRAYGLREITAGIGILSSQRPAGWLWTRVAGDMIDLASLGAAVESPHNERGRAIFGLASVAGVTVLDVLCARRLSQQKARAAASIIVDSSPEECYRFWRTLENLPRFMEYLESVRVTGPTHSHWIANGPGNVPVEWDAEIIDDVPNHRLSWRSLPGADVTNSGTVEFDPATGRRGTIVRVRMDYGNQVLAIAAKLAGIAGRDPEQMIRKELRRFKQIIEIGEAITTEGQPAGRRSSVTWLDKIAR